MIRAFLRRLRHRVIGFQPVSLPTEMKALWGTEQTARVIHPTADHTKVGDHDITGLVIQREREQAKQKVPNVRRFVRQGSSRFGND